MDHLKTQSPSGWRTLAALLASATLGLLFAVPVIFRAIRESDLGWHLALGRLMAQGQFPHQNALSWTAPTFPWYPTSWLFDWLSFELVDHLSFGALQGFIALLVLMTLFAEAVACWRLAPQQGPWVVPGLALLLLPRITERPHVASWALMATVLALVLPGRAAPFWRRASCLPLIALASNFHAGAAFGTALVVPFCLEAFLWGGRRPRELVVAAGAGLALLANPGGGFNLRYLFEHLRVEEVVVLQEFLPPGLTSHVPLFVLGALGIWATAIHLRRFPALGVSFVMFAALGFRTGRMTYEFYLVLMPVVSLALGVARARFGARWAMAGAAAVTVLAAAGARYDRTLRQAVLQADFDVAEVPVRAIAFIRKSGIAGHGFNSFRDGGYIAWALPQVPVFQDGRVQAYPPELFTELQAEEKTPAHFRAFLDKMGVEWALTTRRAERMGGFRSLDSPEWALVYWDELSEVFVRRDVPRFRELIEREEYASFRPYGTILGKVAAAPAETLRAFEREVRRFQESAPKDPLAAIELCAVLQREQAQDAPVACRQAETLATTEATRRLLERALEAKPSPP